MRGGFYGISATTPRCDGFDKSEREKLRDRASIKRRRDACARATRKRASVYSVHARGIQMRDTLKRVTMCASVRGMDFSVPRLSLAVIVRGFDGCLGRKLMANSGCRLYTAAPTSRQTAHELKSRRGNGTAPLTALGPPPSSTHGRYWTRAVTEDERS